MTRIFSKNRVAKFLCALAISGTIASNQRMFAEDWTEFRGPTGQGVTKVANLPTKWSETENVRWFSKTKGLGWSSPIIVQGKIYFTTGIQSEQGKAYDLHLVCLDAKSGDEVFSKRVFTEANDTPGIHGKNSHASPTPLLVKDRLYLHFGHEGTACVDLQGNIVWENREHRYTPQHGNGSSPVFVDNKIVVTCDGSEKPFTLALDANTGKQVWKTGRPIESDKSFSFVTPTVIQINGTSQIITPGSDVVQSLDPKDGTEIWRAQYSGFSLTVRPLLHDGLLYLSTGFMSPKLLAIDPTGKGDITKTHIRWQHRGNVPNTPSLVQYKDAIIMVSDSGVASAIHCKTGEEIWKERLGGNYSASPLLANDVIYFQSESGECVVMKLGEQPEEIARNTLPGRIFACYAILDSDLIIRSEEGVYRIGGESK